MRKILLAAVLALAAVGCTKSSDAQSAPEPAGSATPAKPAEANLAKMTIDEVDQALTAKKAIAVDCNGDRTRKKMGVLPGAILVSDEESFAASELPADKTTKLVFYCANEA